MAQGLTSAQIGRLVQTGRWQAVFPGVYTPAGVHLDHEGYLAAACAKAGALVAASHRSAGWLWGLLAQPPARPSISITGRPPTWREQVEVHVAVDLDYSRVLVRRGIPVTDPLRTLVDLGAVVPVRVLNDAVDRALAGKLLTVEGLEAEIGRLSRQGRQGVRQLRQALLGRNMIGAPTPSVLESRGLRLLYSWGIIPLGTQVSVCDGRYRVDFQLRLDVVLEVDGYAYHWSPEAKAADSRRRNDLRRSGLLVIESDWVTVMHHPNVLEQEVRQTLARPPA